MDPRTTPWLIAYRVEVKVQDRWYLWGMSATPTPAALKDYKEEVRAEPVWAALRPVTAC
jgi:hypothetical protein